MHHDKYKSAAQYYHKYRTAYSQEIFDIIKEECQLNGQGRMLDLGCGTGFLAGSLSKYFTEVIGVDVSAEMLSEAKIYAEAAGLKNIKWIQSRAEDLSEALGQFKLITAGRALHWMDEKVVIPWIYSHLIKDGHLVLMGERDSLVTGKTAWSKKIMQVVTKYTGREVKLEEKEFVPWQDMLAEYPFRSIRAELVTLKKTWNADDLIGFLLSTSGSSPELLGDNIEQFKAEVKETVQSLFPNGTFIEESKLSLVMAKK